MVKLILTIIIELCFIGIIKTSILPLIKANWELRKKDSGRYKHILTKNIEMGIILLIAVCMLMAVPLFLLQI